MTDHLMVGKVSGKPVKVMHYTAGLYLKKIVGEAQVELVGWPVDVPFGNLSHLKGGAAVVKQLLHELKSMRLYFRRLLPEEAKAIHQSHTTPGKCTPRPPRHPRADESQHHLRRVHNARYPRTGAKTPAIVED